MTTQPPDDGAPRDLRSLVEQLRQRTEQVRQGGSEAARRKHTDRGKMLVRDRVDALLERGQVDVVTHGSQHRFDLTQPATAVEMDGTPGERDWQLRFLNGDAEPVTVDARMVDGLAFTEAVRTWRPEL